MSAELIAKFLSEAAKKSSQPSEEAVKKMVGMLTGSKESKLTPQETATILSNRLEIFTKSYEFKRGDLVRWKKGFQNKALPRENEPAIVIDVLQNPVMDNEENGGSAYFQEPLNLILGVLDPDGDFLTFHFDKRRFEPYVVEK